MKRRRARPLEQAERKALLLRCAVRVFARRGIGGARHTEIAREAGVSVPTVFFYFPTREVLVREVLGTVAHFFEEMAEQIHASERPGPEIIMEHLHTFADAVTTHPDYVCVMLEWSVAMRSEFWPLYFQMQEKNVATVAATIRRWRLKTSGRRVEDSENDARVIAVTGYMLAQMKLTQVPSDKVDRFVAAVMRDTLGVCPSQRGFGAKAVGRARPKKIKDISVAMREKERL